MRKLRYFIIFCLICGLTGCGFKPRGSAEMPFKTIYIESDGFSFFDTELRRSLASNNNVLVVGDSREAELRLHVIDEVRDKKILSLSNSGNVREFELQYRVSYQVAGSGLTASGARQQITVTRSLTYSDTKLLAKEEEELLLFEEMQLDAVGQLLRRLVTVVFDLPIRE